ncbi:MAG: 4-alpha-glucanotransferase [Myxococcota bacterium]
MSEARERLEALARLYEIELGYHDISGQHHVASDASLVRLLRSFGVDASTEASVEHALRARRRSLADRLLEPVIVLWEGQTPRFALRIPLSDLASRYTLRIEFEQGAELELEGSLRTLREVERFEVDGVAYADLEVRLSEPAPFGYHALTVTAGAQSARARVISAPVRAFLPETERMWGLFAPTYGLRGRRGSGAGSLAELARLVDLTSAAGGHVVATLPLMSAYLDEPFQPSPYVPVSKLFWNEMFLDLADLARVQGSEAARLALADPEYLSEAERLRELPHVDYRAQARLQRSVLEILCREAFEDADLVAELEKWAAQHPRARDYAEFRAVTERRQAPWPTWPDRLRDGRIQPGDYDLPSYRYHLYAQWRLEQQLGALGTRARGAGGGLYLDLPLGVHPDGYDAWRDRDAFLDGMNAGAPPDALGPEGQDWGFRPLHPERIRETGYRYLIECIQTQVRHAGVLRIDHVMGLHRLFCVPWGIGGKGGVYVRYRPEEIWAIVVLESRRHGAMIVGEDLGTVPDEVRAAMTRHAVQRMFVLQFELDPDRHRAVRELPPDAVASVNTHDTPTFMGFWEDRDIADRVDLGTLDAGRANHAKENRGHLKGALCGYLEDRGHLGEHPSPEQIFRGVTKHLLSGPCRLVLMNLEDLWLEPEPQNVPGTSDERPNWRRRLRHPVEEVSEVASVQPTLEAARELRGSSGSL